MTSKCSNSFKVNCPRDSVLLVRFLLLVQMLLVATNVFGQDNLDKEELQQIEKANQTQITSNADKKSTVQPPVSNTNKLTVTISKELGEDTKATDADAKAIIEKGESQQKEKANQTQTILGEDQRVTQITSVSSSVESNVLTKEMSNKDTEELEEKSYNWNMITAISTALLAFVTWALAYFTYSLWKATGKLVSDTENTSKRQLRAYLGMGGGEVFVLPNNKLRGVVNIKNFGVTPAHNVMVAVTGELREPGNDAPFEDPEFIRHKQPIAPTMSWTVGHEFLNMTEKDLEDVIADRKLVYIWGRVKYQDIYKENQTLEFRLRNVVKLLVTTENGTTIKKWKYYPEDKGNHAS